MTSSDMVGHPSGGSNIETDPLFVRSGWWGDPMDANLPAAASTPDAVWVGGDYHLKSQAGRWDPAAGAWVIDDVTSPCIDAGDPGNATGDEPQPHGGRVNMGVYGGTAEASRTP